MVDKNEEYMNEKDNEGKDDFFELFGLNPKQLLKKYVELNVGKTKVRGLVVNVNEKYGLLKVRGVDKMIHTIRLGKVSDVAYKE